jgi:hypothetical protein
LKGSVNHLLLGFQLRLGQIDGKMGLAALPAAELVNSLYSVDQAGVGFADDDLDANGNNDGCRAGVHGSAKASVEVCGNNKEVGMTLSLQLRIQEGSACK